MSFKTILLLLVISAVISIVYSENYRSYTKMQRGKYYSSRPPSFYGRPPPGYSYPEVFSYTPPPHYKPDDDAPPYPGNSRPSKVSRPEQASGGGLGREELNNLVKYLSKQDLDKIIEYAGKANGQMAGKEYGKNNEYKSSDNEIRYETYTEKYNTDMDDSIFKAIVEQVDTDVKLDQNKDQYEVIDVNPSYNQIAASVTSMYSNPPNTHYFETQNVVYNNDQNIDSMYTNNSPSKDVLFTDSKTMPEEELPKPVNLREDDFEVSFTNNVPTVVNPTYEVKGFGELPLMDYNSKLASQSSYHVPRYTVTSNVKPSSSYSSVPLEPAPAASAARDQSDAHLKAVKIWSHRSKGTAYTLHNDGTLSLERPARTKPYGHP